MAEQVPTILVVDDEQDDLDRVEKALAPIHLDIATLRDPHQVLQTVESTAPHLVILDALLPGLSGFDLCKQLKTSAGTRKTKVIILTGVYLKDRYRREAIHQFKADGFATKPFRDRELQRLVLKTLADKLKMTPMELQDRLAHSKDVLIVADKEEKPGILSRIFGRLRSTPAPSIGEGFLHTAPSTGKPPTPVRGGPFEDQSPAEALPKRTEPEGAEVKPEAVQAEAGPETVRAEVEPGAVQAEAGPETVRAEVEPDAVQAEAGPETVQAEVETDAVQAEADPETVQAEVEPGAVQAEAGSETVQSKVEPDAVQAEAEPPIDRVEEDVATPEPELVEQLDNEANATLAEIVESELKMAAGEDELPEGKSVEPMEARQTQPAEETLDSDRSSPPAEEAGIEPDEPVKAEEKTTNGEAASDLEAAMAVFDALGPESARSQQGVEAEDSMEEESQIAHPPGEVPREKEAVAAEPEAPATDDIEGQKVTDEVPPEVGEELPIYPEEAFLHELRREVMMCRRVDRPLTLILIRIADLGQIVELFGKDFRPKVLRHVAIQAIEALREVDIVGLLEAKELLALTAFASDRYGGERIVNRLQTTLARNPFQVGEGIPSFIPKLRFGMAAYPKEAADSKELLERAEDEVEPSSSTT